VVLAYSGHTSASLACGSCNGLSALASSTKEMQTCLDTKSVKHYIRVMRTKLRNVTVTLEEDVARWARIEAAQKETSVSRYLGDLLRERMLEKSAYESAMRRALARKPFLETDGRYLSREEAHDRARLR